MCVLPLAKSHQTTRLRCENALICMLEFVYCRSAGPHSWALLWLPLQEKQTSPILNAC